ncbi:hypothetical protein D9M68_139770 [compost metagenome]
MVPTEEQAAVVDAVKAGGPLKVKAYAGAGKTSTLRLAAEARGRARGLYLGFNKDITTEAAQKFPHNTRCRTVHSLAFSATPPEITRKLKNLKPLVTLIDNEGVEQSAPHPHPRRAGG